MSVRDQRGQTTAEYMGMLLAVAVIIGALVTSGIGGAIAGRAMAAVCQIAGQGCGAGGGETTSASELQSRLGSAAAPPSRGSR